MVIVDHAPLASHALRLLIRHFSQRKEMVEGFRQVQLLVSKKDIENFNKIRKNLDKLKILVEEAELWVQKMPRAGGEESKPTAVRVRVGSGGGGEGGRRLGTQNTFSICIMEPLIMKRSVSTVYSGASDKGPSEKRTTSLERTVYNGTSDKGPSEKRTASLERTVYSIPELII